MGVVCLYGLMHLVLSFCVYWLIRYTNFVLRLFSCFLFWLWVCLFFPWFVFRCFVDCGLLLWLVILVLGISCCLVFYFDTCWLLVV